MPKPAGQLGHLNNPKAFTDRTPGPKIAIKATPGPTVKTTIPGLPK